MQDINDDFERLLSDDPEPKVLSEEELAEEAAKDAKRKADLAAEAEEREAREAEERTQRCRAAVRMVAPPRLVDTDTTHPKFNARAWATIQKWRPSPEVPWLGLVGVPGKCKSRIATMTAPLVLQATSSYRPEFVFLTGYQLAELATNLYVGDERARAKVADKIAAAKAATLLLLDDLDKTRFTPNIAEVFYAIIDERNTRHRPMIWTSNTIPEDIGVLMPAQFGAAFAGRLLEFSKIYKFE